MRQHDIHDFLLSAQNRIQQQYDRIRKRASEDPGTAGDQGEDDWSRLLKEWLPSYFHVVTKGRILTDSGYASSQIDVLVLYPSYPPLLLDQKLYLSSGVAAAFECKTTLRAEHIEDAVKTAAEIRRHLPKRTGTPYRELTSSIIYGILAHSHSWKGTKSTPLANIERRLQRADDAHITHPIECIDFVTVADLATWTVGKNTYMSPELPSYNSKLAGIHGPRGSASTAYICFPIAKYVEAYKGNWLAGQQDYFSPLGVLLSGLYSKLAWTFPDMRNLDEYFRKANLMGRGQGIMRLWDIDIYSEGIRDRVFQGRLSNGIPFDEWSVAFL